MKPDSNRLFFLDVAVILIVSTLITVAAQHLVFMSVAVPLLLLARFALLAAWAKAEGFSLRAEVVLFLICTGLGAFNDWNSVCNHKIYDYTVPHEFAFSTIPIWMLLFWGMILRSFLRLSRWPALNPPDAPDDSVHLGFSVLKNPWLKIAIEIVLVMATRQSIYRLYLDPVWSWLPFALAVIIFVLLFRPDRHDWKLVAAIVVLGPGAEVLYIAVAHLHRYHLGWFFGVPLWIVLWWVLGVLAGKDLGLRLLNLLNRVRS